MSTERRVGPRQLLLALYALFVVAAGARSAVQLTTRAGDAVLAYVLSAVAAVGYAVGFVLVLRAGRGVAPCVATAWCGLELAGVVLVGAISYARPAEFPDATVWSHFGAGYLYLPVLLPVAVLMWLSTQRGRPRQGSNLRPTA